MKVLLMVHVASPPIALRGRGLSQRELLGIGPVQKNAKEQSLLNLDWIAVVQQSQAGMLQVTVHNVQKRMHTDIPMLFSRLTDATMYTTAMYPFWEALGRLLPLFTTSTCRLFRFSVGC
eukprot:TRINITY_DN7744_c0_g1_i1.p1 TRINITY_DN7744_c0_g1~~TRINITY_DN7744_c0_g1_i1.p1  ORF type:complete len:119 (-),score=7.99 TRINITY_DN7744_c0_g1_i1:149-505(-)